MSTKPLPKYYRPSQVKDIEILELNDRFHIERPGQLIAYSTKIGHILALLGAQIPYTDGPPTDPPILTLTGYVPITIDIANSVPYYWYNGEWHAFGGAGISPTIDNAWVWPDGSFPIFADGSTMQLGG